MYILLRFLVPIAPCWLQWKSIYLPWLWLSPRNHCDSSFSPLQCCLESVEAWAGSVSAKHSCISPAKNNRIMGAGLSLGFLESVPKLLFIGAGKGWLEMGCTASLAAAWLVAGCSGSTPDWVVPTFPTCCCCKTSQCRCCSFLTIKAAGRKLDVNAWAKADWVCTAWWN